MSPGFPDPALPLNSLQEFRCVHMRGRADSAAEISVRGVENFSIKKHFSPVTGMNAG